MLRALLLSFAALGMSFAAAVPTGTVLFAAANEGNWQATRERGSNNWAGYVDVARSGNAFTSVTGTWTVPHITGPEQSAAAQWIGIGGVRATALLQMGTVETIQNGQPVNTLFWEKLPQAAHDWLSVPAGAVIQASIQPISGQSSVFLLTAVIKENNQSRTFTRHIDVGANYAQLMEQSAEWISEDPSDNNLNLIPLANMGVIQYTNATANGQPILQAGARTQRMALIANHSPNILIQTSGLSASGTSFSTQPGGGSGSGLGSGNGYGSGFGGDGSGAGNGSESGSGSQTVLPFPNGFPQNPGSGSGGGGIGSWLPWPSQNQWQTWQQFQNQIVQQLQNQLQQQLQNAFGSGNNGLNGGTSGLGNGQGTVQIITPSGWSWGNFQQDVSVYFHQAQSVLQWVWSGLQNLGNQVFGLPPSQVSQGSMVQTAGYPQSHEDSWVTGVS